MEGVCSLAPVVPVIVKADCLTDPAKQDFLKVIEDNIKAISLNNFQQWICYEFYPNAECNAPPTSPSANCPDISPQDEAEVKAEADLEDDSNRAAVYDSPENSKPNNETGSTFCFVKPSSESCESTEPTEDVFQPSHIFENGNFSKNAMASSDFNAASKINSTTFNVARSLLLGETIHTASSSENGSPEFSNLNCQTNEIKPHNVFILVSGTQSASK